MKIDFKCIVIQVNLTIYTKNPTCRPCPKPTRPLRKLIQTTMTKPITESSENYPSFKNTGENTGLDYARLSISTEMNDRVIDVVYSPDGGMKLGNGKTTQRDQNERSHHQKHTTQ